MDNRDRQDCIIDIQRIEQLLSCGIFQLKKAGNVLQQSAFIDLMICLRDLLRKVERYATRISFTDDILVNNDVRDVTDAVTVVRDACCHIDTPKRQFSIRGGVVVLFSFNMVKVFY